jgi:hypothetical protein
MTQKEITSILYNTITDANYVESQVVNDKDFRIYKGANDDDYMVCVLIDEESSYNSDVFNTINDCYDWINQNS